MNTDIRKYRKEIEKTLKELKAEQQVLLNKIMNGEKLSNKENKQNEELAKKISELESKLSIFENFDLYAEMNESLNELRQSKTNATRKSEIRKTLLEQFKKLNDENDEILMAETGLNQDDLKNLEAVKMTVRDEISSLEAELRVAKRNGSKTKVIKDIETEIEDQEYILQEIKAYENSYLDISEVEANLIELSNSKSSKTRKDEIVAIYSEIIRNYEKYYEEEIKEIINGKNPDEEIEVLEGDDVEIIEPTYKEKTADEKAKKDGTLKKVLKTAGKIIGVATLTAALIVLAKPKTWSNSFDNDKTNTNDSDPKTNMEQTYENTDRQLIDSLTKKGYNEFNSVLMVKNFDKETIEALQNSPYIPTVENYANTTKFNIDYILDYENARTIYNITADKAVDYVNRSAKIQETGFYTDVTINEIVEIVMAIDNKELFTTNNANLAQSFNTSFNRIVDNFLFGTVTEEDAKKLDALQYFAADNTDMDKFLTQFARLSKNVLTNPTDNEAKEKLFNHLNVFATTLNGFTNDESALTENEYFNNNAKLNDYYDWYMAYNSFVAPLYPIACPVYEAYEVEAQAKYSEVVSTITPENTANSDEILKQAMEAYDEYLKTYETDFKKYEDLQYTMITALEGPEFNQLCGESKTLGGE